jgi:hypothetical protein
MNVMTMNAMARRAMRPTTEAITVGPVSPRPPEAAPLVARWEVLANWLRTLPERKRVAALATEVPAMTASVIANPRLTTIFRR